ncbi:MAG: 3-ketoacyl-ACP reductase [Acidobacteria bacterium]|nr:MAG: 3-ketoacyl-ACP reductase [Acidobacteriota bacterium]
MNTKVRVAVVTGSSRGIGRGIAIELARAGWSVVINYVSDEGAAAECRNLCRQCSPPSADATFEIIQADVSRSEDRNRLLACVEEKFGWVDLLVNNAGVAPKLRADLLEASEESFDRLVGINLKGPFFLSQLFSNWWIKRIDTSGADRERPRIVIVSSMSAYTASTNRGDYCLTKAALGMLTKLFAVRLADYGINVYEIRPGIIATDMTGPVKQKYDKLIADGLTPIRRWGEPADVGQAVRAVAEDRFPFSTGEVFNVDGGFHLQRL